MPALFCVGEDSAVRLLTLLFGISLIAWLLFTLPMKLVLVMASDELPLTYSSVHGSVWNARFERVQLGSRPAMRDVRLKLEPLGLLQGDMRFDWEIRDDSIRGQGKLHWTGTRLSVSDSQLVVNADWIVRGLPMRSPIVVELVDADWSEGQCEHASGAIESAALVEMGRRYGVAAPILTGPIRCEDGSLLATLSGETDSVSLRGEVALEVADISWQADIRTGPGGLADALRAMGVENNDGVWQFSGRRRFETPNP